MCSAIMPLGCRSPAAALKSPEVRKHLEMTTVIGREIYLRETLLWWSGNLARATFLPGQEEIIKGWVIDADNLASRPGYRADSSPDVLFLGEVDGEMRVSVIVRCGDTGPESCTALTPPSPMQPSERNLAQLRAVHLASAHPAFQQTSEHYSHAVIPAGQGPDADWWVYLLAVNPDPNLIVLGQHYRAIVDPEGRTVESFAVLSEGGVIDIGTMQLPKDAKPVGITIPHFLDPFPTELHVWAALYYDLDIIVTTDLESKRDGMPLLWRVTSDGDITPFD
jgi:hypothetical protein